MSSKSVDDAYFVVFETLSQFCRCYLSSDDFSDANRERSQVRRDAVAGIRQIVGIRHRECFGEVSHLERCVVGARWIAKRQVLLVRELKLHEVRVVVAQTNELVRSERALETFRLCDK